MPLDLGDRLWPWCCSFCLVSIETKDVIELGTRTNRVRVIFFPNPLISLRIKNYRDSSLALRKLVFYILRGNRSNILLNLTVGTRRTAQTQEM
jgi:hypothetical protein